MLRPLGMSRITDRIQRHWTDSQSQHRKIAQGFLWVSFFVLLGKLAGAAKEMAIARQYGISETVDAYVFIFNLMNWPVSVWFSILTVVLVPLAAQLRQDGGGELPRFRAELLGLALLIGSALGLAAWLTLPSLMRSGWLGLSGGVLDEALRMSFGLPLLIPLGALSGLLSAWLLAGGQHRNTLFEAIPALTLLVFLVLPHGWVPEPLLWGTVIGFALHMLALAAPSRQRGESLRPVFTRHSPAWQGFWSGIGIMAVGQILLSITNLIDQFFAVGLGVGALSTLSYANRILALLLGLGATAIGRATLTVFAEAQMKDKSSATRLALHWTVVMFVAGCAMSLIGWLASPWMVALLFQRGAFTAEDTSAVVAILQLFVLQLPFYFAGLVLVSALAAQRRHSLIAMTGVLSLVFKCVVVDFLVARYQLKGLVISTVAMYALSTMVHLVLVMNSGNGKPSRLGQ